MTEHDRDDAQAGYIISFMVDSAASFIAGFVLVILFAWMIVEGMP